MYFAFPFAARADLPLRGARGHRQRQQRHAAGGVPGLVHGAAFRGGRRPEATIAWATPDAPLVCFQDINRGKWQTKLSVDQRPPVRLRDEQLLAHQLQGGPGRRPHVPLRHHQPAKARPRGIGAIRLASSPTRCRPSSWGPIRRGPLPVRPTSLLAIAEPNVLLIAMKRADQGSGLIVRPGSSAAGRPRRTCDWTTVSGGQGRGLQPGRRAVRPAGTPRWPGRRAHPRLGPGHRKDRLTRRWSPSPSGRGPG